MSVERVYICPLSGARSEPVITDTAQDGVVTYEDPEEDEDEVVPVGWGQIRIRVAAPNPEIAVFEAYAANARIEGQQGLAAMLADPNVPEADKADIHANGMNRVEGLIAAEAPEIEHDVGWLVCDFPVLSPDAVAAAKGALEAAGFVFVKATE